MNQGQILCELFHHKTSTNLRDYEFKVFSQWGEDGIIQRLVNTIEIKNKTFIEFGVQDFSEANCRFLMVKDNWSGFVIDGSPENIQHLKESQMYWQNDLNALGAFITRENIEGLLSKSGFDPDVGILSIDLDGVDYFVFEAIRNVTPRILILEYNPVLGNSRKITVPYKSDFQRTKAHYSNLYFGASLPALEFLASKKGYTLVGTGSAGINAFFVRNELMNSAVLPQPSQLSFNDSKARESRDSRGNLTFLRGANRLEAIKGLPVWNVETNSIEPL